jgi:hypothetical protein
MGQLRHPDAGRLIPLGRRFGFCIQFRRLKLTRKQFRKLLVTIMSEANT